jgi:flagellar biosynthesis protein FliQ
MLSNTSFVTIGLSLLLSIFTATAQCCKKDKLFFPKLIIRHLSHLHLTPKHVIIPQNLAILQPL